ncbi:MAG: hypothetical protein FWE16_00220 [Firmicutes bacterium]|nr:hypothetical protein [Bacillota bacterium]
MDEKKKKFVAAGLAMGVLGLAACNEATVAPTQQSNPNPGVQYIHPAQTPDTSAEVIRLPGGGSPDYTNETRPGTEQVVDQEPFDVSTLIGTGSIQAPCLREWGMEEVRRGSLVICTKRECLNPEWDVNHRVGGLENFLDRQEEAGDPISCPQHMEAVVRTLLDRHYRESFCKPLEEESEQSLGG